MKRILFLLVCLGASASPASAQSEDVVWSQLQSQFTTANKDGFKQYNYILGFLNNGTEPIVNWPLNLTAGRSFMIVGACDDACTDVDLSVEDEDRVVLASDVAADDLPIVRFTPNTTATYFIRPTMVDCSADPCGYGIGVFVRD